MRSPVLNQSLFQDAVDAMPADALSAQRHSAAEQFLNSGFPTPKDENWRYTSLAPAVTSSNAWLAGRNQALPTAIEQPAPILESIEACWIRIQNGVIDKNWSKIPHGIDVSLLCADEIVDEGINIGVEDALSQWNVALLSDVLLVSIAPGTSIDKPLGFLIEDQATGSSLATQLRIVINVAAGASVKLIEAHTSIGSGDHYANSIVQLDMGSQSTVDYVRIQQRARNHVQTGRLTATISDLAELRHYAFDLGGALIRNDIVALLLGQQAAVSMNGLYLAGENQHIDNHTRVEHCVGPSRSSENYRGILNRKSRAVFNGKVVVQRGADGTDASQSNHNLLLSNDAEVDTKPELEIYADDVKCSHGATVGQLDASALFYLRSRGLDENTAKTLLTRAFASDVLRMMSIEEAEAYLAKVINQRLAGLIGDTGNE